MEKRKPPNCENVCYVYMKKKTKAKWMCGWKYKRGLLNAKHLGKQKGCKLKMLLILITGVGILFDAKQKCMCK